MKRFAAGCLVILVGAVLGLASAWVAITSVAVPPVVNGPWRFDGRVGSRSAGLYRRANTAVVAPLALAESEAVYFVAATDDAGATLRRDQTYRVAGTFRVPCRWWSITAYDSGGYLIPNPQHRYSFTDEDLVPQTRTATPPFEMLLSPHETPGHWVPTGGSGEMLLALRIYEPPSAVIADLRDLRLPRIVREPSR